MKKFLHTLFPHHNNTDAALLLLRLIFGFSMLYAHGMPKLERMMGDEPISFMSFLGLSAGMSLGLAIFAELGCSLLLMLGLFTRWAVLPLIITMGVVVFYVHWSDPFSKKEMALMYLTVYLVLWVMGPGRLSLDERLFGKYRQ